MPDVLWPIFQRNRKLLHDLPALAAAVIQQSVKAKYGVRVLILVVPHTFGRHLNFNAHLHVMVSAGGLKESGVCWITPLRFDGRKLMQMWRYAVITYLRAALKKGSLVSEASAEELSAMLETQYERWWNVYVASIKSKWHFLRYVARYVRRPPIAQHRFTKITDREVEFLTKDLKEKRVVTTHYVIEEFVDGSGHARAGPLPTRDASFRVVGTTCSVCDIGCPVCTPRAEEAATSTTVELAEFTVQVFRCRPARR